MIWSITSLLLYYHCKQKRELKYIFVQPAQNIELDAILNYNNVASLKYVFCNSNVDCFKHILQLKWTFNSRQIICYQLIYSSPSEPQHNIQKWSFWKQFWYFSVHPFCSFKSCCSWEGYHNSLVGSSLFSLGFLTGGQLYDGISTQSCVSVALVTVGVFLSQGHVRIRLLQCNLCLL